MSLSLSQRSAAVRILLAQGQIGLGRLRVQVDWRASCGRREQLKNSVQSCTHPKPVLYTTLAPRPPFDQDIDLYQNLPQVQYQAHVNRV